MSLHTYKCSVAKNQIVCIVEKETYGKSRPNVFCQKHHIMILPGNTCQTIKFNMIEYEE